MVIRIQDAARWRVQKAGEFLQLPGDKSRRVVLEVNCPEPTRFDLVDSRGVVTFLAVVQGLETIEFFTDGPCEVAATTEEDWYFATVDGDETGYESDLPSFVQMLQRPERNYDLERIAWKLEQAAERRAQKAMADMAAMYDGKLQAALAAKQEGAADGGNGGAAPGAAASDPKAAGAAVPPANDPKGEGGNGGT